MEEDTDDALLTHLQQSADSNPNDPSVHFNLGVFLWNKGGNSKEIKTKAADHFLISAKLNPQNGAAFRFLGHYYRLVSVDSQRALKCYQRALTLSPDDSDAGESICNLLDVEGKETLEVAICREASQKSPRAFWAFQRLGYLQVHQKKWSEAVHSLQQAIRGYPTSADLWEALGLAYQRLGMFTAAIKAYGRAVELEGSRVFALIESGNIFLMLGSFRRAVDQFHEALLISPKNVAAHYGLASGLLCLSKEYIDLGAFGWGASTLMEASKVAKTSTCLTGNNSCIWKLHGDIQLTYAKCFPWTVEMMGAETDEKAFNDSILSWKSTCSLAATSASRSYQQALHLAPWQANIYTDIAMTLDMICSLKEAEKKDTSSGRLPEKMAIGGLLLEGWNNEFWVALGCVSIDTSLKQHAFIRSLQLDVSLAVAWAYLGKLYREVGKKQLAQQAFDRARSIDPSLALPWAGMSADIHTRNLAPDEAYECCLRAVQIFPLAEFQIGLAKLALLSGQLSSSQVFGAIRQALQRAPHYPESHNLMGLVYEARCDYLSAAACYRRARCALGNSAGKVAMSGATEITSNLARSLCRGGNNFEAVQECENLKKAGILDWEGLQIYALSLWRLKKNDDALSVIRILAASIRSMEPTSAAVSISFICRFLYFISGSESVIKSILKMPKDLFHSTTTVSFVVSSIHALSLNNQLEPIVSRCYSSLASHEDITEMNFLIALGKLVKHGPEDSSGIQNGVNHLKKTLHMYPNSSLIRNLLGYLLLSSKEVEDAHLASRCIVVSPSTEVGFKSASEILGAGAVACYSDKKYTDEIFSVPFCRYQCASGTEAIPQLQKWLRHEPWNQNAKYLLVLNCLQKAREQSYPHQLCNLLERLISVALSDPFYSNTDHYCQYRKFQLLLCASELSFQRGDHDDSISHAISASKLLLPDSSRFFAHLILCRIYAWDENIMSLREQYMRCVALKTDYPIGWMYLKYIESRYGLQSSSVRLELDFEECCSKQSKHSWTIWMGLFKLVQGLAAIGTQDFLRAEEFLSEACLLATTETCSFLCHGVICMELARQQFEPHFLSLAIRSLKKAKVNSLTPIPLVSMLLAQAEASFGSKAKWESNLKLEWFSWPPGMRPAELLFQMHLASRSSDSSSSVESYQSPLRLILQAIHSNPSCLRYWKVLHKLME